MSKKYKKYIPARAALSKLTLKGQIGLLKAKLYAADAAVRRIEKTAQKYKDESESVKKENDDMKNLLSALIVIATATATLGAAAYYLYKKDKELGEYEDLLYTDETRRQYRRPEGEDEKERKAEKAARAARDVKDILAGAAENVKETVEDAFADVKEAIESRTEDE